MLTVTSAQLDAWLAAGYHGEMEYMQRHANLRRDSTRPLPGMRWALVICAAGYAVTLAAILFRKSHDDPQSAA